MNSGQPFISVILATYNRKRMLVELLESLANQTYRDFEVMVVDDCSNDGTWEWLYANTGAFSFPLRIHCMPGRSGGPAAPRNFAIPQAIGSIIAFTDSDCVTTPEWLARGVSHFAETTGFVQGKTIPHPGDPRPMFFTAGEVTAPTGDTSNIFYRREALEQAGGFSSDFMDGPSAYSMYGDDIDLAYRVREAGYGAEFAPDAVVMHHVVPLTLKQWLLRPLSAITGPYLVRRHPRIRSELLFLRYFVSRMTALFDLFIVGLLSGALLSIWCLLLCLPFLIAKYREGGVHMTVVSRTLRLGGASVRSLVTLGALLCGSFRARSLLL
ncbi:MAG: glycosyltransferase family A protein [Terriglobia bacterium]